MHYYFLGICGTGMGNAALLLREMGHVISGSDERAFPPMSSLLAGHGVEVYEGYDARRLASLAPDAVVVGNAHSRGNPEVEWLLEQDSIPMLALPDLISSELLAGRYSVVITGTHGKTTTASLTAHLLAEAGYRPGYLIGGVPHGWDVGSARGERDAPFVIEGDEYDSAFFDKRSKFIHYRPKILVINNLEFDHGDIFRDLADVQRSFSHLTRLVPASGCIIVNADDPGTAGLPPFPWTRVLSVGWAKNANIRLRDFQNTPTGCRFILAWADNPVSAEISLPLHGEFNARNAAMALVAAIEAARRRKGDSVDFAALAAAVTSFPGVRRRQQVLYEDACLSLMEDFGHHPTALAATLASLRQRYPKHDLVAAFEPRSNTAVTNRFQAEFAEALALADQVLLAPPYRGELVPRDQRLDREALAESIRNKSMPGIQLKQPGAKSGTPPGKQVNVCADFGEVESCLAELRAAASRESPVLLVCFSNGSFGGVPKKLADAWQAQSLG